MREDEPTIHRRVLISGLVQRVFFRESCREEAERLGVRGTIENLADGRVLGDFEGPQSAVDELVQWCHHGPPHARVDAIEVTEAPPVGIESFSVRR